MCFASRNLSLSIQLVCDDLWRKKQGKNRVRLYTQMLMRITKRKEASKFIGKLFSESSAEILTWIGGEFPL